MFINCLNFIQFCVSNIQIYNAEIYIPKTDGFYLLFFQANILLIIKMKNGVEMKMLLHIKLCLLIIQTLKSRKSLKYPWFLHSLDFIWQPQLFLDILIIEIKNHILETFVGISFVHRWSSIFQRIERNRRSLSRYNRSLNISVHPKYWPSTTETIVAS